LKHDASAHGGHRSWTDHARRLGTSLGLDPDRAANVATAVGMLVGPHGAAQLARWSSAADILDSACGHADASRWALACAARASSSTTDNPAVGSAEAPALEEHGGYREAVLAFSLPALAAGLPPEPWARYGEALGPMLDVLEGLDRLDRGGPMSHAIPLIITMLRHGCEASGLLTAAAGSRGEEDRADEVQAWLARKDTAAWLAACWKDELVPRARRSLPPDHERLALELLDEMDEAFSRHLARLRFLDMALSCTGGVPSWTPASARDALGAALEALRSTADWPGSWEVRRGFAHEPGTLVGSWFIRGFILRALDTIGEPVGAAIRDLLDEGDPSGLRWYGAWRGIPPDADSLGLALDLATRVDGYPRERIDGWLEPLLASLPESGLTPTWLTLCPGGPTYDGRITYQGNDCTAVRLALTLGLLCSDPARFADLVEVNLGSAIESCGPEGISGAFFYDAATTDTLFLRVADVATATIPTRAIRQGLARARDAVIARIRARQRLDGGWGTPQRTALRLSGLSLSGWHPADAARALRTLDETQRPDGTWAPEPFYLMPGKRDAAAWHQGPELTTAICAVAIAEALAAGGLA
jgi:hypothetical protein